MKESVMEMQRTVNETVFFCQVIPGNPYPRGQMRRIKEARIG
jgi:hypothetical protein